MRIDGATELAHVGMEAWVALAAEVGVSERFARRTTRATVERVQSVTLDVATQALDNDVVVEIVRRILSIRV
jgi:hypothetical protein